MLCQIFAATIRLETIASIMTMIMTITKQVILLLILHIFSFFAFFSTPKLPNRSKKLSNIFKYNGNMKKVDI